MGPLSQVEGNQTSILCSAIPLWCHSGPKQSCLIHMVGLHVDVMCHDPFFLCALLVHCVGHLHTHAQMHSDHGALSCWFQGLFGGANSPLSISVFSLLLSSDARVDAHAGASSVIGSVISALQFIFDQSSKIPVTIQMLPCCSCQGT